MDLHPAEAVEQFAVRNRDELSHIHRQFDDVVPSVFAMLESLHPDGCVHGGVLSALVRDAYLVRLHAQGMRVGKLTGKEGQFCSVRFTDAQEFPCRVHMHPKRLETGRYLSTTTLPETLWGHDVSACPYELAVLWRPGSQMKSLRSISLAAVADLDDRNRTTIYASAPLPPIEMDSYWAPSVSEEQFEPMDDFDDYLAGDDASGYEFP